MHRLIMSSQAYRMASNHYVETNAKLDPTNSYLYRFPQRRLEGEAIRDIMLAANGNLRLQIGGVPFFPTLPENVLETEYFGRWDIMEDGPSLWRRSVYSYYRRGLRYPLFEVFDQPNPNVTCESRDVSTVPTQALCLLNNEFVLQQAKSFAVRVLSEAGAQYEEQVRTAYRIALSRAPSDEELELNIAFLHRQHALHDHDAKSDPALAALIDLCNVMFNLNEFVYIN